MAPSPRTKPKDTLPGAVVTLILAIPFMALWYKFMTTLLKAVYTSLVEAFNWGNFQEPGIYLTVLVLYGAVIVFLGAREALSDTKS